MLFPQQRLRVPPARFERKLTQSEDTFLEIMQKFSIGIEIHF